PPVLAAEKSKTAFYIAGGILVAWALLLSLGIGLRRPSFPRDLPTERIVIAISVVLVLGAVGSAVVTAGTPEKTEAALGVNKKAQPAPSPSGGAAPPSGGAAPSSTGTQAAPPAAGAGGSVK